MTISCSGIRAEPSTCQGPVMPGVRCSRRRCQPCDLRVVLVDTSGRGPTRLISPLQHVDQLRQLVERRAAQQPPDARDARVVGDLEQAVGLVEVQQLGLAGLGVVDHRAELEDPERARRRGRSRGWRKKTGPARVELDRERDRRPAAARAASRPGRRAAHVERALDHPRRRASGRTAGRRACAARRGRRTTTDEPTTSSSRGSTLTFTPTRLGGPDELEHVAVVGAARGDDHALDVLGGAPRPPARRPARTPR